MKKSTSPLISVVVCTYNGVSKIKKCLDALNNQSLDKEKYEVVVVNDGSTDDTAKILKKYKFKIVTNNPNQGLAQSRNNGAYIASGDILAFTDDDCIPNTKWLENILIKYKNKKVDAVGGKIIPYKTDSTLLKFYAENNPLAHLTFKFDESSGVFYTISEYIKRSFSLRSLPNKSVPLRMIVGANMSMRRNIFELVGGFDPTIKFGGEEEDLWKRLLQINPVATLLYEPKAIIKHDYEDKIKDAIRRNRSYGAGSARNFLRYKFHRLPVLYPFPLLIIASILLSLISPYLLIVTILLPMALYPGWLKLTILKKRPHFIFYSYLQMTLELVNDYGFITGLMESIWNRNRRDNIAERPSIVHVASSFPPALGGMEKVAEILASTQNNSNSSVSVFTSNQHTKNTKSPAHTFPIARLRSWIIANTTIIPSLFFKLIKLNANDTVHLHVTQAFTPEMVWLASRIKKFPYIAHIHIDLPRSGFAGFLLNPYKKYVLGRVLRSASFVSVFTDDQKNDFVNKYGLNPEKVTVIPNGVEEQFYFGGRKKPSKKTRLLFVGRLGLQKNLPMLLHSLDGMSNNFITNIVGDGELDGELKQLAKDLKLKNVIFHGRADGEKLLDFYKESDVFVLTSEREGMPLVLLEAMAMGLPIVSTDVTGSRDVVVDGENGYLVPLDDTAALKKTLQKISSDIKTYKQLSQNSFDMSKKYSWSLVSDRFKKLYEISHSRDESPKIKRLSMWKWATTLLLLANLTFLTKSILGSAITITFFLLVPGYLLLNTINHNLKSRWEVASLSLGLSVLLLMVGGLALNSLHALGLERPLETVNIFAMLDLYTIALIIANKNKFISVSKLRLIPTLEEFGFLSVLTILPILAVGGAIRLNNGASDVLTMILFAMIPVVFMLLIWRKNVKHLYPYAVFMFALSVLLTTSLRGWGITGHDIQHEFSVFQIALKNAFWDTKYIDGPYNACLSITILPVVISKITAISSAYIYKAVYQLIFAFGIIPIYLFTKKLSNSRIALIAAMLFVSFPTFLNDMPFLNRQEMAFVFFGLILLVNIAKIAYKPKMLLTILLIAGLLLSHYSSNYIAIGMFIMAWAIYQLLIHSKKGIKKLKIPVLSIPVLIVALLMTFIWNVQITSTAPNLESVINKGINIIKTGKLESSNSISYGVTGPKVKSSEQVLKDYANEAANNSPVFSPEANMPLTPIGTWLSHFVNVESVQKDIRLGSASALQILLVIGIVILFIKQRVSKSKNIYESYFLALAITSLLVLVVMTLVPGLSVSYGITRLFQQTLVITSIPIIIATSFIFGFLKKSKIYIVAGLYALLFLHLSGFATQLLGGYPPQLALNNAGTYYNIYYSHTSDTTATTWLTATDSKSPIIADSYATSRLPGFPSTGRLVLDPIFKDGRAIYSYDDYANVSTDLYAGFISGDVIEYSITKQATNHSLVYSNQSDNIYKNSNMEK